MKTTLIATLLLTAASPLLAQTSQSLIGLTRVNPSLRQQRLNCTTMGQCNLPGMPATLNTFAGGTAWDSVHSGAWVTNGRFIARYDDNCQPQCPPIAVPALTTTTTFITGLEVVDAFDQLWMVDSEGRIRFYSNTCPPQLQGGCNSSLVPTPAPNQRVTTGIAVDEGIGLVFVAYANLSTGTTKIAVNDMSNPCVQFDIIDVPPCTTPFGAIRGIACDWGSQIIYATDGYTVVAMNYAWNGSNLTIVQANCCPAISVTVDPYAGLAVRPGGATSIGTACNNGSCANCPMIHTLRNDPVLGNQQFSLALEGAFGSSFSFCMIGDSPCHNQGVVVPPLCGPVHVGGYVGYLGPVLIQGPSVCGGSATFNLPLPASPALVGDVYSSQCLNLCVGATGALGFSLSNCLSWELQGI
ncbi:MAG TPA: hypothetical protein ENI87_00455 [bacterium]|nr:hypothetical protein [bacterium]